MKRITVCTLVLLFGCTSDQSEPDRAALLACESEAFAVVRPLGGPGLDPETGFVGAPLDQYVVHTTQIVPRSDKQDVFLEQAGEVAAQLAGTEGLVAYGFASDEGCGDTRTLGVWESREAMYAFVVSGAHEKAMGRIDELSVAGRVTHWTASAEEVLALDWDDVKAKIAVVDISPLYP